MPYESDMFDIYATHMHFIIATFAFQIDIGNQQHHTAKHHMYFIYY